MSNKQDHQVTAVPAVELPEKLSIGVIQLRVLSGDVKANIAEAERCIKKAVERGGELILLPELWSIGIVPNDREFAEEVPNGLVAQFLIEQAKKYGVYICGGVVERVGEKVYNGAILIDDQGEILLNYHKVQLYTCLDEDKNFDYGEDIKVVSTKFGRIGIVICYDGDFPEAWRTLAIKGADIVLHPCAYESPCDQWGWWEKIYTTMTMLNGVWCVSANLVTNGSTDGERDSHFFGWSNIINPLGEIVAKCEHVLQGRELRSTVLVENVNIAEVSAEGRRRCECFFKDLRPELYCTSLK